MRGVISYFGEHQNEVKKLHTILGFKSPSDILFREDLKKWEQQMDLILTVDSSDDDAYRTGLVTKYIPELEPDNIHETAAIVVGPDHDEICSSRAFKAGNEGRTDMDLSGKKNVLRAW